MADLKKLYNAVLEGDPDVAIAATEQAILEKIDPTTLIMGTIVPAMDEVGRLFESGKYYLPDMIAAVEAMKPAMDLLRPLMTNTGADYTGRVVMGTVAGDMHDIGKNLVVSMLEGGGFEVIDLGVNVPNADFVAAVKEKRPQILALSGLLTVTIPAMRTIIEALKQAGLRDQVKVLVGGAPVTPQFAKDIGADGYGESASAAVKLAKQICTGTAAA